MNINNNVIDFCGAAGAAGDSFYGKCQILLMEIKGGNFSINLNELTTGRAPE
jgi:hypothetical protein